MSALLEEPITLEMAFPDTGERVDRETWEKNCREVLSVNREATATRTEDFAAFLDLLYAADSDYIDAAGYAPEPPTQLVDWDAVGMALSESQQILIGVQNLLAETLAAMGVEDYQYIRVYADTRGFLRLVSDHDRRDEIESVLNGPDNADLRNLYHAAVSGMSLAGGLVGNVSVPPELLAKIGLAHSAA